MANYTLPRQTRILYCTLYTPGLETRAANAAYAAALSQGVDIVPYIQQINIFESIFDNTLSGTVLLYENVGLAEHLPIVGVEVLHFGFAITDGQGQEHVFERAFRVVGLRDVSYPKENFRTYTLDLATHEYVNSMASRMAKFFENKRCDEAVTSILFDTLQVPIKRVPADAIEETFGRFNTTIPNYTPLQAINYFTMLAQTTKSPRESNFLFFETLTGFHFKSITKLIVTGKANPKIPLFKLDPNLMTGNRLGTDEEARNTLTRLQQEQTFDTITDIQGGLLRSKMVHFDFLARKLAHEEDSRYTESFPKTTHLAANPFYPANFDQTVSKNTRIFTFPSNIWSANSSYLKQIETTPVQNMWEAVVLRNRQLREIQHLSTLIDIPGRADLRAGAVVNIQFPMTHVLADTVGTPNAPIKSLPTPLYSGLHLVTAVRHQFKISMSTVEYRMHIRACRDGFDTKLQGFADARN